MAAKIAPVGDVGEFRFRQQLGNRRGLVEAVFEKQPSAGFEMHTGAENDGTQCIQTLGAGGQRVPRFEADITLYQVRIVLSDIRRVGHDEIEFLIWERMQPVALPESDVMNPEPVRVSASNFQSVLMDVGGQNSPLRALRCHRDGDGAAPRADICHRKTVLTIRCYLQRGMHKRFRIRPWNQYLRRNRESHGPEFAFAQQVSDGFSSNSARNHALETFDGLAV